MPKPPDPTIKSCRPWRLATRIAPDGVFCARFEEFDGGAEKAMRHLISLGRNCDVAFQLRMHGAENVPHFFDWLTTPVHGLIKIFETDFDVFHPEDLALNTSHETPYVFDQVTGVAFFHQFPLLRGASFPDFLLLYKSFIKIIRFRARQFREYVTTLPVTLVRKHINEAEALRVEQAFFKTYPNADAQFLYLILDGPQFRTPHGHARSLERSKSSLGDPKVWIGALGLEGLIDLPYRHSTAEVLGFCADDVSLSPDDRFSEPQLSAAIWGNPTHSGFWLERARHYRRRQMFALAEQDAEQALELDPADAHARLETIIIAWFSQKMAPSEAADALIELSRNARLAGLFRWAGWALMQASRLNEAVAWYTRAADENPMDHTAFCDKAICLYRLGQHAQAERSVRTAIQLDHRKEHYHQLLGQILEAMAVI